MLTVEIKRDLGDFKLDVAFETDGEIMGLLGASGCGKSMTLKCIAGIEKPDKGKIILDGRVLFDSEKHINLSPQERRVGYLFQQYALFPNMTVEQNISAGCREKSKTKRAEAVREKIRAMHLEGLEKNRPHQLSGGQQQRVALARILINEPRILLLDEPFTALDSYLKWQVELEVADTLREYGRGALLVSHNRDEIYRLCESVCVLDNGKSEKKRSVSQLFSEPETLAAGLLSGCKNFSRLRRAGGRAEALDWGISLDPRRDIPEQASYVGIRANHIVVTREPGGANTFPCVIERVVDDVFTTILMLGTGGSAPLRAEGKKADLAGLRPGDQIFVHLPAERLMLVRE